MIHTILDLTDYISKAFSVRIVVLCFRTGIFIYHPSTAATTITDHHKTCVSFIQSNQLKN